jgi:hypothetical protein
VLNDILDQIT